MNWTDAVPLKKKAKYNGKQWKKTKKEKSQMCWCGSGHPVHTGSNSKR